MAALRQSGPGTVCDPAARPDLTVVMVVYHTGPALERTVARVIEDAAVDELVIVDNGSPPDQALWLQGLGRTVAKVRLIQGHGNVGFARGANMGAAAARGRGLIFLNPDAFLEPGAALALAAAGRAAAMARPGGGPCVIGARILNTDGSEQRGGRRGEVTPVTALMSLTHAAQRVRALRRFEIHQEDQPLPLGAAPVATISGACFFATAEDFAALGGFDEGFFLHVEDVDLCWRARRAGGQVLFEPGARVTHLGSTSLSHPLVVEFHKGRGLVRYFLKRADNPWRWLLALGLSPLIMAAAVGRPLLRRLLRS